MLNKFTNYKIDEYQLKTMTDREKLDFDICLNEKTEDKSIFNKRIRNQLDIYSQTLNKKGVLFFGFTINFQKLVGFEKDTWKMIHFRVEELISLTAKRIELCEFIYLSIEEEKNSNKKIEKKKNLIDIVITNEQKKFKGLPQIHGIIGVRSLVGRNPDLLLEIKKQYNDCYNDILIKELTTPKQIKNYWNYVIKENNFKFHRLTHYSNFFEKEHAEILDLELSFENGSSILGYACNLLDAKYNNIIGIGNIRKSAKSILLYLINLYCHIKGIFLYNNNLYIKNEETKFSWKFLDEISYISDNNLKILEELRILFPQQLNNFEISDALLSNFELVYNEIKKHNSYLPTITLDCSVIEFTDGLYFLDSNYFFDFFHNKDKINKLNINCFNYFDKSFYYYKNNKPVEWLNSINKYFNNLAEVNDFCVSLGNYFHLIQLKDNKKKTICITSSSITGKKKLTLVANIITENTGLISNVVDGFVFAFEQVDIQKDTKLIICDELKYLNKKFPNLLEIFGKEFVLIENKYVPNNLHANKASILFIFNHNTNNKLLEDQAFINKLLIYTFTYQIIKFNSEIKKMLIDEFPKIMLYCNQLYFEKKTTQDSELISEKT